MVSLIQLFTKISSAELFPHRGSHFYLPLLTDYIKGSFSGFFNEFFPAAKAVKPRGLTGSVENLSGISAE